MAARAVPSGPLGENLPKSAVAPCYLAPAGPAVEQRRLGLGQSLTEQVRHGRSWERGHVRQPHVKGPPHGRCGVGAGRSLRADHGHDGSGRSYRVPSDHT